MILDIGLGSNVGDRLSHLQSAVDGLRAAGFTIEALSGVYETDAVGGPPQPTYLNAVVRISADCSPRQILEVGQALETAAGRERGTRWGPRPLDVDILRAEGETTADPDLQIPHPRLEERAFVLVPLRDIDVCVSLEGVDTSGVQPTHSYLK